MRASFAFDKRTSPVGNMSSASKKKYPTAQYMGLCQFDSAHWEFDRKHNYSPTLVFDGRIERLDAIDTKFPHNIDTVYFSAKNGEPSVRFECSFTEEQLAKLAGKGFWSADGVHLQEVLTSAKFQLEVDATVEEITDAYKSQNAPIMNVTIEHPYDNKLTEDQYDVIDFISREQPDEKKAIENNRTYQDFVDENSVAQEVEAAKKAMEQQIKEAQAAAYKPLSPEEMALRRQSANVDNYVNEIKDSLQHEREVGNAIVEAEQARIKAEQEALEKKTAEPERDPNAVEFDDAPASKSSSDEKLVETDDTNKYDDNEAIFKDAASDEPEELPEQAANFLKRLAGTAEAETSESNDKKGDKNESGTGGNSDSGAASGAQGLGVYTFEDQSTAQFEMRQDEGKGNEKPDDDKSDNKADDKNDNNSAKTDDNNDTSHKKAQLTSAINETTVSAAPDREDRSK